MDGLVKIFNDIQTEEWTDYYILKDFTENEQTRFCYDWDGLDYERVLPAITNILKENQQLKKQKDDVVEYIKTTTYSDITGLEKHNITEFWFIKDLLRMLGEIDEI